MLLSTIHYFQQARNDDGRATTRRIAISDDRGRGWVLNMFGALRFFVLS